MLSFSEQVMNKATVKKCICCESPRPHVADHARTTVASAAPVNDLGVAAGSDSSGGFHFPASTTQRPLFGQAPPSTTPPVEHTGTGPLAPAGKRRHQNEDEDDEEGAQADHCDRKRRGTAGESLQTPSSTSIIVVKASETAVGVENAEGVSGCTALQEACMNGQVGAARDARTNRTVTSGVRVATKSES